jgi:hypothetical protein
LSGEILFFGVFAFDKLALAFGDSTSASPRSENRKPQRTQTLSLGREARVQWCMAYLPQTLISGIPHMRVVRFGRVGTQTSPVKSMRRSFVASGDLAHRVMSEATSRCRLFDHWKVKKSSDSTLRQHQICAPAPI